MSVGPSHPAGLIYPAGRLLTLRAPLAEHLLACPWIEGLVFGRTAERPFKPSALGKRATTAWRRAGLERLTLQEAHSPGRRGARERV